MKVKIKSLKSIKDAEFIKKRSYEALVFLILFFLFFGVLSYHMGISNMLKTIMNTAWDLLMNTVFYIMGITVLTGALGRLMIEFGVVRLLEKILSPLMRPLFRLPGVASLAGLMTFFSDNPAIISLANDKNFSKYFLKRELVSLTNFGTAFGMGLIVLAYMTGFGYFKASFVGLFGALFGAIVSTRIMQYLIRNDFPDEINEKKRELKEDDTTVTFKSEGGLFMRFLNAILDGGKSGVQMGLEIIPGVLIISTVVMVLTFSVKDPSIGYQGLAYEGVPILPHLADKIDWFFMALFGFENPEFIAFPITSLGAVGAALSLVKAFAEQHIINGNAIAVFTAMGMCWSGYLSTHTAMLDSLGYRKLTGKALLSHTFGGLAAGIFAHYCYLLVNLFM